MSELTNRNKLTSLLFLVPVIWMTTGMLWDGDGDMRLVPIVLIVVATSLVLFRFEIIKDNFKNSFWIKLLIVNGLFGIIAYEYYGFDSRELRATLVILFLLTVTPRSLYTKSAMQWMFSLASLSVFIYSYYHQNYINLARGYWPINAIPFATICGLILISLVALLLIDFKGKSPIIIGGAILLSSVALLLTQSRGPLIALLFVVAIIFLYYSFKKKKSLTLMVFLGLILSIYSVLKIPLVEHRVERTIQEYNKIQDGDLTSSVGIRLQMLAIGSELWKQKPILGFGKDIKHEFNRLEASERITPEVNQLISMTFHNGYLDKFVLYGIPGGVIFLVFLLYPLWAARGVSLASGSSLLWGPALFISVCNFSDAPFINAQAAIYYMFIIGSVTMMLSNEKDKV